jgi:putative endonuclease
VPHARQRLGTSGESRVALWYEDRGYRLVARNWRSRSGELDLILRRDDLLAFCEVKTRSSSAYGSPALAVGPVKQDRLRRLAMDFLRAHPQGGVERLRFDVASVVGAQIDVIEAAF